MFIVIAGGGLKGISLAAQLVGRHDVLVIDRDPRVCDYVRDELGAMAHLGTATSTKTLEAIGLSRADVAVALMRDDADNLAFILLANRYGVRHRLVRMREPDFEQAFQLAGATGIVSSVAPIVDQLMIAIEYPGIKALNRLGKGRIDVFEVAVPDDGRVVGMAIEAIARLEDFPDSCSFVAVEAPDGTIAIAKGTTRIPPGAIVIVLAMAPELDRVLSFLTQRAPGRAGAVRSTP
ncbi:Trk system potassium uptake protein TrkA [compost metagenome]